MVLFGLALGLIAAAVLVGFLVVRVIAAVPLSVLAQAEEGGRFVGLGAQQAQSTANPPAGKQVPRLVAARGYGY